MADNCQFYSWPSIKGDSVQNVVEFFQNVALAQTDWHNGSYNMFRLSLIIVLLCFAISAELLVIIISNSRIFNTITKSVLPFCYV